MKVAFISGIAIAVIGIIVSLFTHIWQIAFLVSASTGLIGMVISGLIKNYSLIMRAALKIKSVNEKDIIPIEDEYWIKVFGTFAFPNIITALILYFILYR